MRVYGHLVCVHIPVRVCDKAACPEDAITLNEEARRALRSTSNQSSSPVKWHNTRVGTTKTGRHVQKMRSLTNTGSDSHQA